MNKSLMIEFAQWLLEINLFEGENGLYTTDTLEDGYMNSEDVVDWFLREKGMSLNIKKPFIVANIREILDKFNADEISYSKMVELFNEKAAEYYFEKLISEFDKGRDHGYKLAYNEIERLKEIIAITSEQLPKGTKFETGVVNCDICNYKWVAVRPFGLEKLECPHCRNLADFEVG